MDSAIFEQIYQEYVPQVFRFLLKLTGNYDIAEDLTQETFVRAYENLDTFRGECRLYVWLCQIGKNLYFNYLKKEEACAALHEVIEITSSENVEDRVLDAAAAKEIMEVVADLPEPYQTVFLLRVFSQFSFHEIGATLVKTEVWARVTYYRGKKMLQEKLKREVQ